MEIKIAVCDDEYQQTEYIKSLVSKWASDNNIAVTIEMFDSAAAMIRLSPTRAASITSYGTLNRNIISGIMKQPLL